MNKNGKKMKKETQKDPEVETNKEAQGHIKVEDLLKRNMILKIHLKKA